MPPKISLLVPCYNVEKYVGECLDSAISQTLEDIEIICINDGSTDSTLDILQSYASRDPRIKIIDKPNEGYGKSMNKGLDEATGEYIGILESDDFIDANMLEDHYRIATANNLDAVKSNFYFYWSTPVEKNVFSDLLEKNECGIVLNPLENKHIFYVKPSIWSAIYKRDFLIENKIRFNETPGASYQDASFNFQIWLYAKQVEFIHDAYLHYRQDNEASSVNSPGKVYCVCDEYAVMEEKIKELPDKDKAVEAHKILVKMKFDTYMWNYFRLTDNLAEEFLSRVQSDFLEHEKRGEIDWSLFDKGKTDRLKTILTDPEFFHMTQRDDGNPNKVRTIKRFYEAGGIPYVKKLIKYKFSR